MVDDIFVNGGFRTHLLIPHIVVGTIIDDESTFDGLKRMGNTYYYNEGPVLKVKKLGHVTTVTALTNVWLQEPMLAVKSHGFTGEGWIQGFRGIKPKTKKYHLLQKDASKSTVHFMRYPFMWNYVNLIKMLPEGAYKPYNMWSDGGFSGLLSNPIKIGDDWKQCRVFDEDWELKGTKTFPTLIKRWEAAGKLPDIAQVYFGGWLGGAGAVVNDKGSASNRFENDLLCLPRAWKLLERGHSIRQELVVT